MSVLTCDGCKYWSELIAQSIGCGPMLAMCLNPESLEHQQMRCYGCGSREEGRSIDDPSR